MLTLAAAPKQYADADPMNPAVIASLSPDRYHARLVHRASSAMRSISLVITLLLLLSGCSWLGIGDDDDEDAEKSKTAGYTEKDFYDAIQKNLDTRNWTPAIEDLQALEAQFPFGNYAEQAQLELIYAQYGNRDYEATMATADRFIRLHPRHPNVDYALYMKGLASFAQSRGFFDNFLPTDETERDPGTARDSFTVFSELVNSHPSSIYSPDARKRMIHIRNVLAYHEIHVANYYFKRGAYVAAANRGRYVVENFQMTPAVPDGLAIMAEAYHLLGLQDLSAKAVAVLVANYPQHPSLNAGVFVYQKNVAQRPNRLLKFLTLGLNESNRAPYFDSRKIFDAASKAHTELELPTPPRSPAPTMPTAPTTAAPASP